MTGVEIALVLAAAAAGGLVQGCVGIGMGLVAAPIVVSIDPAFAPGPLLLIGQIVGLRHLVAERANIDWPALKNIFIGVPFGLLLGMAILVTIDKRTLAILVGSAIALAGAAILLGAKLPRTQPVEVGAGALMAFASTTAGLPGPPLVIAFSDLKPSAMRGTASAAIMSVAVLAGVAFVAAGRFGFHELTLLGLLIPGAVVGLLLARFLRPHLDRSWFRFVVLLIAVAGGLTLVIRQL